MSEKVEEVRTVLVRYICDKCAAGEMVCVSSRTNSCGTRFLHECKTCHHGADFPMAYPAVRYEPAEPVGPKTSMEVFNAELTEAVTPDRVLPTSTQLPGEMCHEV